MPLGIGLGRVVGLVQETRRLEGASARIAVSGSGASALAASLVEGGDVDAVSVDGDPVGATVAIRLIAGDPSDAEVAVLRRISRANTPVIVVRRDGAGPIPHVVPSDVLDVETEVPIAELAAVIARIGDLEAPALAARLPVLRPAVARRLVGKTSLANAVIAASPLVKGAQLPLITLAQGRMLLLLDFSRGNALSRDPQQVARLAGPAIAGSIVMGVAGRELVRRLPVGGPVVRAAVAYAGTRALAAVRLRF